MENKVNYNEVAPNYNSRFTVNDLKGITDSLEYIITQNNYTSILEVGCGTGHWLKNISSNNRNIFGCDLSIGMIKEITDQGIKASLFCADANKLPVMQNKFDLIFCVNALHHFPDKLSFIKKSKKLLTDNGSLCIYGVDPRYDEDDWYLYSFFENSYENDLKRFPSFEEIEKYFNDSGYKNVKCELIQKVQNDRTAENILEDPFLQKGGTSQLALLAEEEYQKGIIKIKKEIQTNRERIFKTRITFKLVSGKNL